MLDSTIIRAHACSANCTKNTETNLWAEVEVVSPTKIHLSCDALGNALRFTLSVGQRHDITQTYNLIEGFHFERVIADTAYDAEHFLETIRQVFAEAIIPPRSNRKELRELTAIFTKSDI